MDFLFVQFHSTIKLFKLLFNFCNNIKLEVPKEINLNDLIDKLIKEIGFTK